MKKTELVFVPAPLVGHLVSMVEMAKILVDKDERLFITFLILKLPSDNKIDKYAKLLSSDHSTPRIRYVELNEEKQHLLKEEFSSTFVFDSIDSHKRQVRDILAEICSSENSEVAGVILDMFCTTMIDVANEYGVPSYIFYTSGAAMLGLVFYLQSLRDDYGEDIASFFDKQVDLEIPTYVNPVPSRVLPGIVFDKEGDASKVFLDQAKRFRETKGIVVNTFLELEFHAVHALLKDKTIPPVYTAGPILNLKGPSSGENQEERMIMKWLDLQPNSSVVFLCFGSQGTFTIDQVSEIAYALEHSGHRFLWSLRKPAAAEGKNDVFPGECEDPEEVLPEGFLQRTGGMGKVIGWAPQLAVLSHPAVSGFVSHCGWNSTLESVWCGVPIAAFPVYAEQQANAFLMVKDLGLAVEIKIDHRKDHWGSTDDIVQAQVIEEAIRHLMNHESGMRNKVKKMKEKSRLALKEDGSSSASLRCFISDIICKNK